MLNREGTTGWRAARMQVTDSDLIVNCGTRMVSAPLITHANGETDPYTTLAAVAKQMRDDGIELRGCANCERFRFSGMSRQMSGGTAGYCGMVGFRNRRGIVTVDHGCGEHRSVVGWPDELLAVSAAQRQLSEREPLPSRQAAFEGAILGLAIGDALGLPAEFRRRPQILRAFGPAGITDFVAVDDEAWPRPPILIGSRHAAGTYSDDTQMTIAVAEALIEAGRQGLDALMDRMGQRFVVWSRSSDNNRAAGATCMQGCDNLARGVAWRNAGVTDSKGCGSAMRVAPIGLFYWRDHAPLLEVARASCLLTHGHDAAIEGAAAAALLVGLAMEKKTPQAMYDALIDECAPRSADFKACLEKLPTLLADEPAMALSRGGLGEGWVAEEAVVSALYCFWRSPEDFRQTVLTAVNTDGDSDSIACIAGSISGAFNGLDAIPPQWRLGVEKASELQQLARRLWEATVQT